MTQIIVLAVLLFIPIIKQIGAAKCGEQTSCSACVAATEVINIHCRWCVQDGACHDFPNLDCPENQRITQEYDCPVPVRNGYQYDDAFARNKALPLSAAAYSNNPQACLTNAINNAVLQRQLSVYCDSTRKDTCSGFTAVSHSDKAIIASFRGTSGTWQLTIEGGDSIFKHKVSFPGGGKVDEYFFNAFNSLWSAGMHQDLLTLQAANPDYDLWVTGHSLGGAMASLCSSFAVTLQMWPSNKVKMVTFGQPRTGDMDYARAHDNKVYYSYRVVHQKCEGKAGKVVSKIQDLVAHIPPKFPDDLFDSYYHHRYEVWYNNDMSAGSAFQVCTRADDDTCSNTQTDLSINDHLHYFGVDVSGYGEAGCQTASDTKQRMEGN